MSYANQYTSDELFHFVGHSEPDNHARNFETLTNILTDRCISYSREVKGWGVPRLEIDWDQNLADGGLLVPSVVCFADIPRDLLALHMKKYGQFGLALKREVLIQNGTRPVMYIPTGSRDARFPDGLERIEDIEAAFRGFERHCLKSRPFKGPRRRQCGKIAENEEEAIFAMRSVFVAEFLAFLKPFDSLIPVDDPDNFYLEREWRKFQNMCFELSDITTVVVPSDYKDRLLRQFPEYEDCVFDF